METESNSNSTPWIALVALLVALLAFGGAQAASGPGADHYAGSSSLQPADAALESAGASHDRASTARLYNQGWWSIERAVDGFVLVHHP